MLREAVKMIELHSSLKASIKNCSLRIGIRAEEKDQVRGLYLSALANGVDVALKTFREHLVDTERKYLDNTNLSLGFILGEIKIYEPLLRFFEDLLNDVKDYHGCAILKLLHRFTFHADPYITAAIKTIRKAVYAIFLRQLSQWIIYGHFVDTYEEFFIVHSEASKKHVANNSGTMRASGFLTMTNANINETNVNADLWQYHIKYDVLPACFSPTWAEKVLFIGQTVRMLQHDARKTGTKKMSAWNDDDEDDGYVMDVGSLWNNMERVYFDRIQTLFNAETIDVGAYEAVINEIKTYVTGRLSEIAFNQADLLKHLRLIKEYFLLGRGEFFLELIIQTEPLLASRREITDRLANKLHQAFQTALNRTFTDLEQITIHLPLDEVADFTADFDDDPKLFLRLVRLKFNVKWPLHLFFSPLIIDRYNHLFRFLLQIRRMQNDLHTVWRMHREQKVAGNSLISQLRNRMLFFVDNLQYYLQVDVLESQYSILINAVQNSKDFEFIQRTHSVFQANILSLCFLLNGATNGAKAGTAADESPVLVILHKIMKTIRLFCALNHDCSGALDDLRADNIQLLELNDKLLVAVFQETCEDEGESDQFLCSNSRFSEHIEDLMTLLSNRMAGPASEPLSQFLLRLDFNYWFSNRQNRA